MENFIEFNGTRINPSIPKLMANAKNKYKLRNPIQPNAADLVQWELYDRNTTAANTATSASYTFYNVPIGQNSKTKADTNMEQVSRLPDPQFMNVQSLGFQFMPDMIKVDIDNFIKNYWFEFWVGQKVYAEGPLQSAASGYGYTGYTTQNNIGTNTLGNPNGTHLQFNLVLPAGIGDGVNGVSILQGQQFYVKVIAGTTFTTALATSPVNGTGVNLMCFLTGILSRGVQ
jgi:hypothetical protein